MDVGYTYVSQRGDRLALYVRPGLEPAPVLELTENGQPVRFDRVSDRELACGKVAGVDGSCESFDCHRAELGKCKCGRHKEGVRIRKAVRS